MSRVTVRAIRATITDTCRETHGDIPAFDEALKRLKREYFTCVKADMHHVGNASAFHLDLSVEYDR